MLSILLCIIQLLSELCDWLVQKTNLIQDCAWISHNIICFCSVTARLWIITEAKGAFQKSELAIRIMVGPVILTMKYAFSKCLIDLAG